MQESIITAKEKFIRKRPAWIYFIRHPLVYGLSFLFIVVYMLFLLPKNDTPILLTTLNLSFFVIFVLAWSANFLADSDNSELLKGLVAFGLLFIFCWLFYQYSGAQWDKLQKSFFDWKRMSGNWMVMVNGLLVTLQIALLSALLSIFIGLFVAILRFLGSPTLNIFLVAYVDFFRSIPMAVLMVVLFFALPYVGISLGSITTTVVALAIGYGAYMSECFRSGFEAVHWGQIEAARSLGLTRWQTIRVIILPQAIPVVIPTLTGNLVSMIKDTAVASLVASPELLKRARELYTSKASPTPLVAAALFYLAVLIPLVRISNMLEKRVKKTR